MGRCRDCKKKKHHCKCKDKRKCGLVLQLTSSSAESRCSSSSSCSSSENKHWKKCKAGLTYFNNGRSERYKPIQLNHCNGPQLVWRKKNKPVKGVNVVLT